MKTAAEVQSLIDEQQQIVDKATEELAKFDSQPAMVDYEAQRQQIHRQSFVQRDSDLRHLDAENRDLLRMRIDLLAFLARADLDLQELKSKYAGSGERNL